MAGPTATVPFPAGSPATPSARSRMRAPAIGDYEAGYLATLMPAQLREERDFLFRSIRNYLRWGHRAELREAQDKLIAVTLTRHAKKET